MQTTATLDDILEGLMRRYRERVPDVGAIVAAMTRSGLIAGPDAIENDHIAFRTMGVPQLGIRSLERIFLHHGYTRQESYDFPQKKLNAFWYAPPSPEYPRIFISELRVGDLSVAAQRIIASYTDEVPRDPVDALDLDDAAQVGAFLHQSLWRLPNYADYQALATESEYAAWVIYNRYYLNHFTVTIHNLPQGYNSVAQFNAFLKQHGFRLNTAGGEVKVSEDGALLQSSTVAELIEAEFGGGERHMIAGSYVEFAERRALPEFAHLPASQLTRAMRREGFEARNANKIFESTYRAQVGR